MKYFYKSNCILLLVLLISFCKEPVLTYKNGKLSSGSYLYIKELYYTNLKKDKDILENLKTRYSIGELANKLKLKDDKNYKDFLQLERRARRASSAIYFYKQLYQESPDKNSLVKKVKEKYRIEVDPSLAEKAIKESVVWKLSFYELDKKENQVMIGKISNENFTLEKLKEVLLDKEIFELLNYRDTPWKELFESCIEYYSYYLLDQERIKSLNAKEEELIFWEHSKVSELFVSAKYANAEKGVYPTESIEIKLHPEELFNHFHKIKEKLIDVKRVEASYIILKDENAAKSFYSKLKLGEKFIGIAKQINSSVGMISPIWIYNDINRKKEIDTMIIDLARQNILISEPMVYKGSFLIVQIYQIEREKLDIPYKDYSFQVELDLKKNLLSRQYEIDKMDTMNSLGFHINY